MKFTLRKVVRYAYQTLFNRNEERVVNGNWTNLDYILTSADFTSDFLAANKQYVEVEHQVGRFLNMRQVIQELEGANEKIEGDIVEFGTWQGLGLIYLARLLGKNVNHRRLIGIDSFEGLPHDSTIWRKGDFANTELNFVANNFFKYAPANFEKNDVLLIKGWFSDANVAEQLYASVKKIALVHFDADLFSSTKEALELVEPYLKDRVEPVYFLFDDWGCHQDEVPEAFYAWLHKVNTYMKVTALKLYTTKLTRYYKLTFN